MSAPDWLICNEETLKHLHLGAGEAAIEAETAEERNALLRQANAIHAVGVWRFPETWGDGMPL